MTTTTTYPKYKSSGVGCIQHIPNHWNVQKLKHIATANFSNVDKHSVGNEKAVRLCNYVDVYYNDFITSDLKMMKATATHSEIAKFTLKKGDVIVTKDSEAWDDIAVPAYVPTDLQGVLCGYHLAQIRPNPEMVDGKYLFMSFCSREINDQFRVAANGITRFGLGKYWLENGLFFVPPIDEQHAIADFLNRETERIDGLIARKERQIELLGEKCAALISHAVTKGLDLNVKMKPSGIEWIGDIPEHWEVVTFRRLIQGIEQGWSPVADDRKANENEWGVIKLNAISKGFFCSKEHKALPSNIIPKTQLEIKKDDFLLTRANTPKLVGDVCLVGDTRPYLMLCDLVYRIAIKDNLNKKFLAYWILSSAGRYQIECDARGTSQSMVKINQDQIRNWFVLLPPISKQIEIVNFIDNETNKINKLIAKISDSNIMLYEYRTALISAAVTGKIDVRKEVSCQQTTKK